MPALGVSNEIETTDTRIHSSKHFHQQSGLLVLWQHPFYIRGSRPGIVARNESATIAAKQASATKKI